MLNHRVSRFPFLSHVQSMQDLKILCRVSHRPPQSRQITTLPSPNRYHIVIKDHSHGVGRFYANEDGTIFPSVTTILSLTQPYYLAWALGFWSQHQIQLYGELQHEINMYERKMLGSRVHGAVESYLLGGRKNGSLLRCVGGGPTRREELKYCMSVKHAVGKVEKIYALETYCRHPLLGYAGTVDCVGVWDGVPCVIDWKTAKKSTSHTKLTQEEVNEDYRLQLAAYTMALQSDPSYSLHHPLHALLVLAYPDGKPASCVLFTPEDLKPYMEMFTFRLRQFDQRRRTPKLPRTVEEALASGGFPEESSPFNSPDPSIRHQALSQVKQKKQNSISGISYDPYMQQRTITAASPYAIPPK
eukprot:comp148941_c0_seq1/m.49316 comp148941_c0_seq1/g.49316  ORF comp148941_c0_seq1/g.49316 comp148941_c0_seq1/m.49316 type:complete len:358 (-) comp148941_c0_seq1:156-1229(-)